MEKILKIFRKKIFYAYFVISFILIYILSSFSYASWFGIWTSQNNFKLGEDFVREGVVDDTVLGTTIAGIQLGRGELVVKNKIMQTLNIMKKVKNNVNKDIVTILENGNNKDLLLENYINETEKLISEIKDILPELENKFQTKRDKSKLCNNKKNRGDSNFFKGLNNNDGELVIRGINNSKKNAQCYIKNRVVANAYENILKKLNFYSNNLNNKYNIIVNNKRTIIQNFKLFKNTKLEKLASIRDKLRKFNVN